MRVITHVLGTSIRWLYSNQGVFCDINCLSTSSLNGLPPYRNIRVSSDAARTCLGGYKLQYTIPIWIRVL